MAESFLATGRHLHTERCARAQHSQVAVTHRPSTPGTKVDLRDGEGEWSYDCEIRGRQLSVDDRGSRTAWYSGRYYRKC